MNIKEPLIHLFTLSGYWKQPKLVQQKQHSQQYSGKLNVCLPHQCLLVHAIVPQGRVSDFLQNILKTQL